MAQNNNSSLQSIEGKKILFLITQSKYGGAQKYILQLANYFKEKNEVRIVVGEKDDQDPYFFAEAKNLGIEPIVLSSLIRDISLVKAFDAVTEIRKLLIKERPDILHLNSSMGAALGSTAAWLYGFDPLNKLIRVVYTVHGFVFNEPLSPLRKKLYLFIEKTTASWKGALITVSDYDRERGIARKIAPPLRMVTIHNGIATDYHYRTRSDARKALNLPDDATIIGSIAALYKTKGINHLLDAAKKVKQKNNTVRFAIIGDGPEKDALTTYRKELELDETVVFLGHKENAMQYVKAFDLMLMPSMKEGFPYALLEAGLAGIPLIASRVGGIPELIEHNENGILTEVGNSDDIAHAIMHLVNDQQKAKQFGERIQQKIHTEFSLKKMLSETEKLYLKFYRQK